MRHRLSKSRFVTGWQCTKYLWWRVHEPLAVELQPDIVLQDRFDQGVQVGRLARELFPGGVLIDEPHDDVTARVTATRDVIDAGAPAIFEATFLEDGVFVAVDVLLREADAWTLLEVKSSSSQKPEHIPDAAIQTYVLRRAGLDVRRVAIMHLDKEYRHPDDLDRLLARTDVTTEVEAFLPQIVPLIEEQRAALAGPLPDVAIGLQCWDPKECPFVGRCWPQERDHIRHLYSVGPKACASWMHQGVHWIADIPQPKKLHRTQQRQIDAIAAERLIVEPGLAAALEAVAVDRLGHLDFETIQRAVPVWHGQKPWEQTAVQFSYHESQNGSYTHRFYLAEGPADPRAEIADLLIEATSGADRIVSYSHFEKTRIKALAEQVPARAAELLDIANRLVDLLPIVREHVYHPEFRGSFSLKYILTPLIPDLSYDDLTIVDGMVASVEIARLLFFVHLVKDRAKTRQDLLDYCERDTWAMVRLVERLQELAGA